MQLNEIRSAEVRRFFLAVVAVAALAGCETPKADFEECEEGVGDLSRLSDVAPPSC